MARFSKKKREGARPVDVAIRRYGGDSFKYCEPSRFTTIEGELTRGAEGICRIIFRYCPMKWSNNKKPLSSAERRKVLKAVGEYLDRQKVRWKFSNFGKEFRRKV